MRHRHLPVLLALASALSAAGPSGVSARSSNLTDASSKLTGTQSREWLAGDVKTWMGSDTSCTSGERYRFYADKTLRQENCSGGHIKTSDRTWSLSEDGPLDVALTIDGDHYLVIFFEGPDKLQHMILRTRSDSKVAPNVDREFILSGD